jgi:putative aminopeptidase FrvX
MAKPHNGNTAIRQYGKAPPGQTHAELGVRIAMPHSSGPFDYSLTTKLNGLCEERDIPFQRDISRFCRCASAATVAATGSGALSLPSVSTPATARKGLTGARWSFWAV